MRKSTIWLLILSFVGVLTAQNDKYKGRKFEQLGTELATPNVYRTASGAPGHKYWQQKADYVINVEIDDEKQILTGSETITYTNNSPDVLTYLWVQLDQNVRQQESFTYKTSTSSMRNKMSTSAVDRVNGFADYDGGHKITKLTDANGKSLKYTINYTMMRIDLPKALNPGEKFVFNVDWHYNINDRDRVGGRGGHNYFKDGNYIYTITQWFPRMAVYSDFEGWQNKQFMGRGEFALVFGDYDVKITVPADHIVASTGELQNPNDVLTKTQRDRLKKARTAKEPVKIVTRSEALKAQKSKTSKKKTWHYVAKNVRDFAFGSSRKFIWDAMGVQVKDKKDYWTSLGKAEENGVKDDFVWAMSYYADEAYETYEKYSTHAVAHTLESYSRHTIPYPYPVAISVEASNGMEYPMICFNYGRPASDGTYSERTKYGMIGVIIHEVGHNFFPMIVNSDERQWTWMDEGLNTFSEFIAEQEWEHDYPMHYGGPAHKIINYMKSKKEEIVPIMTNSEQVKKFGPNAYAKPAVALNILRETVLGRELFDFAYQTYARRWAFKHPTPEDFFRTMEDASGVDLDWFWKGWFFSTDHVDISIESVKKYNIDTKDPEIENKIKKQQYWRNRTHIANERNKNIQTYVDKRPRLNDFYNKWDRHEPRQDQEKAQKKFEKSLDEFGKEMLDRNPNFYEVKFKNVGGLVMPIIIEFTYEDGSKEVEYLPAEIWRMNEEEVTRVFVKDKEVTQIILDPYRETADTDENNNYYPQKIIPSRFEMFKRKRGARGASGQNPMQKYGKKKK